MNKQDKANLKMLKVIKGRKPQKEKESNFGYFENVILG